MKEAIMAALNLFDPPQSPEQANLFCFPELDQIDEGTQTALFRYRTHRWMRNIGRVVHGGVIAIIVDNSMGLAVLGALGAPSEFTPTITMTIDYKKPVQSNCDIYVRTRIEKQTARTMRVVADLYAATAPEEVLVKASGIYFIGAAKRGKK